MIELGRGPKERAAAERAWRHIQRRALYPRPVELERVRIIVAPLVFRLPWIRRFSGYTIWSTILLRQPLEESGPELIAHELVHVWQQQHGWVRMWLSYLRSYENNRYEIEAREAAAGAE
jgi:Domain of unknown function (DUF4157)